MSASPFAGFTLSTLKFRVGDGVPTIGDRGSYEAASKVIEIQAYLVAANRTADPLSAFGESLEKARLKGYCVEPMLLPDEVLPGMVAEAVITGVPGRFEIALTPRNPVHTVRTAIGDQIEGVFTRTINRGDFA